MGRQTSRESGNPAERARMKFGKKGAGESTGQVADTLDVEQVNTVASQPADVSHITTSSEVNVPVSQVVDDETGQKVNASTTLPADELTTQQVSEKDREQASMSAPQLTDEQQLEVDKPPQEQSSLSTSQPSHELAPQQESYLARIPAKKSTSQPANENVSQTVKEPTTKRTRKSREGGEDREQQAIYMTAEQRRLLRALVFLEERDISDIMGDALSLYAEQSPHKAVIPMVLAAQRAKK